MATLKPDLTRVWADLAPATNVVDPDVTIPGKFSEGWGAEVPPFEHFNYLQKMSSQGLAHINEQGIPVWDENTVYPTEGIVKGSDGNIYIALLEQSGNTPVGDTINWGLLINKSGLNPKSRTEMKAITGLTAGDVVNLSEGGRSGPFETLPAGDYSAEITADPLEGVYILLNDGQTLKRRLNGYVTPEMFGGSGSSEWQAALDAYPVVKPQGAAYTLNSMVTVNHWNTLKCLGQSKCTITGPSSEFAFDVFVSSGVKTAEVSGFTLISKDGIRERYAPDTDFTNDANPTRTAYIHDINLLGTYDVSLDVNAGSAVIPTMSELTGYGIGLLSVMNYGAKRERIEFRTCGIGLAAIGDTLCKTEQCKFYGNARHIVDQHVPWYNSAFGMGADNEYNHNDMLDGRRWGGVYLLNSYGAVFEHNYMEHLNRNGNSSEMMLAMSSVARTKVKNNHFNASLSVTNSRPFLHYSSSRADNSISADNAIEDNYLTPFTDVRDTTVDITSGFNHTNPKSLTYRNNALFPDVSSAGVQTTDADPSLFSANNCADKLVSGALSLNEDMWTDNGAGGYYAKTAAENLIVRLTVKNPSLDGIFALEFDVDDNSTGNGRIYMTVKDSDGTTLLWNANAFAGVTSPSKISIAFESAIIESEKNLTVEFASFINCKLYSVRGYVPSSLRGRRAVFDPSNLVSGTSESTTVTVTGARVGDVAFAGFGLDLQGVSLSAYVSADDTVTATFSNNTGVDVNLGSSYINAFVSRAMR